jgi:hypothetical protein
MLDAQLPMSFSEPQTPAAVAVLYPKLKARRDTIRAAGGADYEALLARERAAVLARRTRLGRQPYDKKNRKTFPFRSALCANARARGRKRGFGATITPADLIWPSHCPVLGLELDYPERTGMRGAQHAQPNWPSLDRWDSTKGYVPGNVFVISYRANTLKNSATYAEILKVAKYLSRRPK